MALAGLSGFIALGFEIAWYRVFAVAQQIVHPHSRCCWPPAWLVLRWVPFSRRSGESQGRERQSLVRSLAVVRRSNFGLFAATRSDVPVEKDFLPG